MADFLMLEKRTPIPFVASVYLVFEFINLRTISEFKNKLAS